MTDVLLYDPLEVEEFIESVATGVGPQTAALAVGWTPRKLADLMKDESFRDLILWAEERKLETVEAKCFEMASRGNSTLIQFYLLSKGAHRGWRPPTQRVAVNATSEVRVEHVLAQKEALLELLSERGVVALQPAPDAIETSSTVDD